MKYVSYEVARALKAAGFKQKTFAYYRTILIGKEQPHVFHVSDKQQHYNEFVDAKREWFAAPTIKDAFEWLLKINNGQIDHPNFNGAHPELKEGEIFLINLQKNEDPFGWIPEKCSGGRVGNVAYDNTGKVVENMYPLFGFLKK